jgi:SOS-response transcriptional repressor LexA
MINDMCNFCKRIVCLAFYPCKVLLVMINIEKNNESPMDRIASVLREKGLDNPTFQSMLGIQSQHWNNWKTRGVPADKIFIISGLLGINADWIKTGEGDKYKINRGNAIRITPNNNNLSLEPVETNNADTYKERIVRVPMIPLQESVNWRNAIINCDSTMIMANPIDSTDLFAVRVIDDSMRSEQNEFNIDDVLIIDPAMEANHLHYVIALVGGVVTFRQLFNDMGEWLLRPINPQFNINPLRDGIIIGVVRRKIPKETDYC